MAVGLVLVLFPEVFVAGGSLSPTGLNDTIVARTAVASTSIYPNREDLDTRSMQLDVGARTWQLEPAIKYMNRVIHDGESVEWNRYSAGGMQATEPMADMKLSPFVLLVALFGGTSASFTLVMLTFALGSLYCLQQLYVRTLRMGRLAGIAAGVFFILNGWAAGALGSQMSAPYLIFPIVLYTLCELQRVGGRLRFLAAVGAYVALFTTTFFPGVVLVLLVVHAVALLLDERRSREIDPERPVGLRWLRLVGRQAMIPTLGVLVTAVVWLPAVVAVVNGGDELNTYAEPDLRGRSLVEALGLLTPRHFFRWYAPDTVPSGIVPSWTLYLGVVPMMVTIAALPRARGTARGLLAVAIGLTALGAGLHLAAPVVSWVAQLPLLRPVTSTYWASLAAAAATVGVGAAVCTIRRTG